jgi:putative endopeptidase
MYTIQKMLLSATLGLCLLASCKNESGETTKVRKDPNKPDCLQSHLNDSIKPGDDFFNYANGGWVKKNPIPASENGWGIFSLVEEENKERILKLSEDASANANSKKGSNAQLIGDFFSAGMDSIGIEKLGVKAIQKEIDLINNITTKDQLIAAIAHFQTIGVSPAYGMSIYADLKNSSKNALYLNQGGLGLPDRDYYFSMDAQTSKVRQKYPFHIAKIHSLAFGDSAQALNIATAIQVMEAKLAGSHRKLEELRDPEKNYNKMATSALISAYPNLAFDKQFAAMNIKVDTVIVGQPEFFKTLDAMVASGDLNNWKNYLKWNLINNTASTLNQTIDKANFEFYGKLMSGTLEQRPRWKRVLDAQESAIGDALGQLYVQKFFNEKTKKRYVDLTEKIVASYAEHIKNLPWMGDSTKQKALTKLNAIIKKVGYPDKWKDYSAMQISRNNYAENVLNSNAWAFNNEAAKLGKPVDRTEWGMTPQTYNAYYNPTNNEIVLPAAMFIAPGYADDELDDALVYGYVGASTIGHELTHGFDDEGRQFDDKGNLVNWWTATDAAQFKERADRLVDQFNKMTILGDKHPNGKATLGENIADLGGIVIAYDAFKQTAQYKEGKKIGGLTPAQRYFLGYAFGWMQVRRPEKEASLLLTDVHAPISLRVNGPMSNCDAWYEAFNVQKGDKLWRDSVDRVRIW